MWLGAIAHFSRTVQLCEEMCVLHRGHILEVLDSSGEYVCAHRIAFGDMSDYFEHVLKYSERNSKTTVCREVRITCAALRQVVSTDETEVPDKFQHYLAHLALLCLLRSKMWKRTMWFVSRCDVNEQSNDGEIRVIIDVMFGLTPHSFYRPFACVSGV